MINDEFLRYLLAITKSSKCIKTEVIQSLWSGYGEIARFKLFDSSFDTVVVKCIAPNKIVEHPRGWNTTFSHQRKLISYQVETSFYKNFSSQCNDSCSVPSMIGAFEKDGNQWIILEDLDLNYPIQKTQVSIKEVKWCLKWLAGFHAQFMNAEPKGLWEIGTYWHLATRPDEFEAMNHPELKAKAASIDDVLNQADFKTLVHGDAKLANFCFSNNNESVAAVDFQYVGGGCGMKDVAYFLGSCLSSKDLELHEEELLNYYFEIMRGQVTTPFKADLIEKEWRGLYPFACADFTRFLLGWMPTHHKINDYNLEKLQLVMSQL